jgi:uncharacterized protein with PQ loop repeat
VSLADALGWTAAACVVALHLPQVHRTVVQGRTAGVPSSRAWVAIAVSLVWLGYGLYGGGAVQVVLNGTCLALNGLLLTRLVRSRREALCGAALTGLGAAAVVAVGSTAGMLALGVIGAAVGTVVYLPQLLALRTAAHADGVSPLSLWLQGVSGSCWIGYGVLRSEAVVWAPNVAVLLVTAWTLVLLRDRRARPVLVPSLSASA